MRKLILWVPVLMVGSLMYWTIALNFGGMSLVALSSCVLPGEELGYQGDDWGAERGLRDSYQMITVNVADRNESSARQVDEEPVVVDIVSDRDGPRSDQRAADDHRNDQGPGETAF